MTTDARTHRAWLYRGDDLLWSATKSEEQSGAVAPNLDTDCTNRTVGITRR